MSPAHPQPRGRGRTATGRAAVRLRQLARSVPDLHDHLDVDHHRRLRGGVAQARRPPGAVDGHRHDVDRLAGPDHELVAVRGLQPASSGTGRRTGRWCRCRRRSSRSWSSATSCSTSARTSRPSGSCAGYRRARPSDSFVWRHPLISLGAASSCPSGSSSTRCSRSRWCVPGFYIYSQVIPFGSVFVGETYQFPFIWETVMVTFVMIPAGVLLYRDDTGRTVAEKLAQRARIFASRPALGMFVVMFVIINIAYFAYGTGFAIIKWTKTATSVACPWPYPEAKVYDPQGFYEENGQPGPYSVGIWSTWMSMQPDGRPDVRAGRRERSMRTRKPEWLNRAASSSPARRGDSGSRPRLTCTARAGVSSRRCARSTRAWSACAMRPARRRRPAPDRCPARSHRLRIGRPPPPRRSRRRSVPHTAWCTTQGSPPPEWSRKRR